MGHTVTLGGDRLGSGNKNKIALNDYMRSTHNLSQKFTSSMQCGTLYPFIVIPAMRGDKFEIDLAADCRTIPTKGPLFGSFKMQVDLFQCDVRLYQAILHNNPLAIGLKMGQVKFPVIDCYSKVINGQAGNWVPYSNSCLMKYLGLTGIGTAYSTSVLQIYRKINAIPMLAYYEIFKTYYANKQEENAYIIGNENINGDLSTVSATIYWNRPEGDFTEIEVLNRIPDNLDGTIETKGFPIKLELETFENPNFGYENNLIFAQYDTQGGRTWYTTLQHMLDIGAAIKYGTNKYEILRWNQNYAANYIAIGYFNSEYGIQQRGLTPFKLANIDDMRLQLLSHHTLGVPYEISGYQNSDTSVWGIDSGEDGTGLPYVVNSKEDLNRNPLNGLCVKTYQSDLFNNWVNTEWIDGENGIAAVTAISTASGSIKIDSINFAEKLYNMMNRIAVSDGSYEGWQDAVYTETPKRHIESPIYLGGMSSEVMFEEIVQTSTGGDTNPLGTLAGKGRLIKRKGGRVVVKTNEAAFIIGIVSLTPRVNYSQGNEFYLTDLLSMDDFHKPALDGIGFQNLVGERMAWWDTKVYEGVARERSTIGKVPAWIEYMTAVDKTFGDFAETEGRGFMALNRHYEVAPGWQIKDATTYIDPRKYNYAFAVQDIDAQNFWVQIQSTIKARRLMSAKQIPNI